MVEYLPQCASAKKAPTSGVRKQVPIHVDTFLAAPTLLSWSVVVRYVTRFRATAKKHRHSLNSVPRMKKQALQLPVLCFRAGWLLMSRVPSLVYFEHSS